MRRFFAKIVCFLLPVLLSVAGLIWLVVVVVPPQFMGLQYSAFVPKVDRLVKVDSPRIILVSGSSASYGIDRQLLEQETGLPVCNMALDASLGMPFLTNLVKSNLREGDLVVLAYEYLHWYSFDEVIDPQVLMATCDARPELLQYVEKSSYMRLARYFPTYVFKKLNAFLFEPIVGSESYQSNAYNEFGDMIYPRSECILSDIYSKVIIPTYISPKFVTFVNDFCAYAQERGAQVVISEPPVFEEAIEPSTNVKDDIETFENGIREMIDCPVISNGNDYVFPRSLMYDTVYHCNDEGARTRTLLLSRDIARFRTSEYNNAF